jgi:hypothetical protein
MLTSAVETHTKNIRELIELFCIVKNRNFDQVASQYIHWCCKGDYYKEALQYSLYASIYFPECLRDLYAGGGSCPWWTSNDDNDPLVGMIIKPPLKLGWDLLEQFYGRGRRQGKSMFSEMIMQQYLTVNPNAAVAMVNYEGA